MSTDSARGSSGSDLHSSDFHPAITVPKCETLAGRRPSYSRRDASRHHRLEKLPEAEPVPLCGTPPAYPHRETSRERGLHRSDRIINRPHELRVRPSFLGFPPGTSGDEVRNSPQGVPPPLCSLGDAGRRHRLEKPPEGQLVPSCGPPPACAAGDLSEAKLPSIRSSHSSAVSSAHRGDDRRES